MTASRSRRLMALLGLTACGLTACAASPGSVTAGSSQSPSAATVTATAGTATASPASVVTPSPATTSSPTPRATRTGPGTLTDADSGGTVSLRVGEQVTVVLGGHGEQWDQPAAQGAAVRRTAASGGYPTQQAARATFLAVADGRAHLIAMSDAACLHSQPRCMIPQREWSVDVVVRG